MAGLDLTAPGTDALARGLADAARDLADLSAVNAEAGRVVDAAARPPVRTGALAASQTVHATPAGVTFSASVPYAAVVHAGQPWITTALKSTADEVVALYLEHTRNSLTDNL